MKTIEKIALVALDENNNMLLLRKKGLDFWILPGGKIEPGENHLECLDRELEEELHVQVPKQLGYALHVKDIAAGTKDTKLSMHVYFANYTGVHLTPANEILYYVWAPLTVIGFMPDAANSLKTQIVPWFLRACEGKEFVKPVK